MGDALIPMGVVPKRAPEGTRYKDEQVVCFSKHGWWNTLCGVGDLGFLPLPADASSPAVAKTAGEWLAVCDPEDVADVIRYALANKSIRQAFDKLEQEGEINAE